MILAHLIGEQTLPNLLAALAIRPSRIVHVVSDPRRFAAPVRNLERALARAGLKPDTRILGLPSLNPTPTEVVAALEGVEVDWRPSLVNVTGGTKLMSIGAKTWADLHSIPSLYVDTSARAFVSTGSSPLPVLPPLPEVADPLSLEIVLTAHGVPANKLRGHTPTVAELAYGREAAAAWSQDQPCAHWVATLRARWLSPNGHPQAEAWSVPVAIPAAAALLAQAAATAQWAQIDGSGRLLPRLPVSFMGDQNKRNRFLLDLLKISKAAGSNSRSPARCSLPPTASTTYARASSPPIAPISVSVKTTWSPSIAAASRCSSFLAKAAPASRNLLSTLSPFASGPPILAAPSPKQSSAFRVCTSLTRKKPFESTPAW